MKKNNKGFTLAELLIVVAIIGVLVAISIPIFNNQLRKARFGPILQILVQLKLRQLSRTWIPASWDGPMISVLEP
jgi:prepilin-type N-terminal cleavage/methylation domain-containing protein